MNIEKQTFNTLDVLYDDKKWGKRIDPDEWNANFKVLEEGHNELATKLNQQVTDIDTAIQATTSSGGQNISVQYGVGTETLQVALDNVVSDINNRYTKNEVDASIGSNTNSLIANAEYNESTGVFTFTRKDGSSVVIDTVIEKVPASMALVDESDGSVSLVITNQDGSQTKTNVTSLIEDTVINSSDTINATSATDAVKKVTTYTLTIKPNSIGLSHVDTELTAKFDETQTAKTLAIQAKDNAVAAKTAAETARNNAQNFASEANTYKTNASVSAEESADSALEAKGYAEQASSYKNSAELAKVAAEKARDEAQSAVGGDFATKSYVDDKLTGKVDKVTGKQLSTEDYTTAEKNKLSGITAGANNYTHPSTHPASMITQDSTHRFVTDTEKDTWNTNEVFIATYGTTTNAEIEEAYQAGKAIFCKYELIDGAPFIASLSVRQENAHFFGCSYGDSVINIGCVSNTWQAVGYSVVNANEYSVGKFLSYKDGDLVWVDIKPTTTITTLTASSWDSTSNSYSFESTYANDSYDIEVALDGDNATDEQINAWIAAKMLSSSSNKIIAKGTIPTVDIPIILTVISK